MAMTHRQTTHWLNRVYRQYHHRRYTELDPIVMLYRFDDVSDREIIAVLSSALAYGRVRSILNTLQHIAAIMTPTPRRWLEQHSRHAMHCAFDGFRYRFTSEDDLVALLWAMRKLATQYGSLGQALAEVDDPEAATLHMALSGWVRRMEHEAERPLPHLLPDPQRGSACKRLHLMMRWMVRHDAIDPGGWEHLGQHRLTIPVDTHMHRLSQRMHWTDRRTADARTAAQITDQLRRHAPQDPVRFDFALTRPGILNEPMLRTQSSAEVGFSKV